MAHLTRIFMKATQAQSFGPILLDYIIQRYLSTKKMLGLTLNFDGSSDCGHDDIDIPISSIKYNNNPTPEESKNKFGRGKQFYPKIDPRLFENLRYITGVSLTSYSIGWSKIDLKQKEITNFGSLVLSDNKFNKTYELNSVFKVARAIFKILPASDLYIFENVRSLNERNKDDIVTEIKLLSMLTVMLNICNNDDNNMEKVFFQNASVIDYLYELRIKGERISTGQKLQRLLDDVITVKENFSSKEVLADLGCAKLNLNSDFLKLIYNSQPLRRDASATSFFLVLSFMELNKASIKDSSI